MLLTCWAALFRTAVVRPHHVAPRSRSACSGLCPTRSQMRASMAAECCDRGPRAPSARAPWSTHCLPQPARAVAADRPGKVVAFRAGPSPGCAEKGAEVRSKAFNERGGPSAAPPSDGSSCPPTRHAGSPAADHSLGGRHALQRHGRDDRGSTGGQQQRLRRARCRRWLLLRPHTGVMAPGKQASPNTLASASNPDPSTCRSCSGTTPPYRKRDTWRTCRPADPGGYGVEVKPQTRLGGKISVASDRSDMVHDAIQASLVALRGNPRRRCPSPSTLVGGFCRARS